MMNQYRPSGFPVLPIVIKNLLIINVLFFLAQNTIGASGGTINMMDLLALHHVKSPLFEPWQIITHMFLHGDFFHIFFNMLVLWMFGETLEGLWGPKRFLTFYFICGIGAALLHLTFLWFESSNMLNQFVLIKQNATPNKIIHFFHEFDLQRFRGASEVLNAYVKSPDNTLAFEQAMTYINDFTYLKLSVPTVGASGAVSGVMAAYLYLFPNRTIYVYFFPIKAKWLGIIYFGRELVFAVSNMEGDNIARWAHIGGALVGFLLVLTWNRNNRRTFY